MKKMESHMEMEDALRGGWDLRWWIGNLFADAAAGALSEAAQVPRHCVAAIHLLDDIAAAAATRGAATLMRCMERDPLTRRAPRPREGRTAKRTVLLAETTHKLGTQNGTRAKFGCTECGGTTLQTGHQRVAPHAVSWQSQGRQYR